MAVSCPLVPSVQSFLAIRLDSTPHPELTGLGPSLLGCIRTVCAKQEDAHCPPGIKQCQHHVHVVCKDLASSFSYTQSAFFKKKYLFIYLFGGTALGLCCCARAFSSWGEWGLLFIVVHRLLIAVASLVAEHGL